MFGTLKYSNEPAKIRYNVIHQTTHRRQTVTVTLNVEVMLVTQFSNFCTASLNNLTWQVNSQKGDLIVVVINGVYVPDMILKLKNINVFITCLYEVRNIIFSDLTLLLLSICRLWENNEPREHTKTAFINLPVFSSTKYYRCYRL